MLGSIGGVLGDCRIHEHRWGGILLFIYGGMSCLSSSVETIESPGWSEGRDVWRILVISSSLILRPRVASLSGSVSLS